MMQFICRFPEKTGYFEGGCKQIALSYTSYRQVSYKDRGAAKKRTPKEYVLFYIICVLFWLFFTWRYFFAIQHRQPFIS